MVAEPRRRTRTRQLLLDAALELVAERSLQSTSVEAVCERAGFTRGAFYSSFSSIDDLVVALYEQRATQLLAVIGEHGPHDAGATPDAPRSPEEPAVAAPAPPDLRGQVAAALELLPLDRTWYLLTLEMAAQALRDETARAMLAGFRRTVRTRLSARLDGVFRAGGRTPTVPVDELAGLVIALCEGLLGRQHLDAVPTALTAGPTVDAITGLLLVSSAEVSR